MNELESSTKKCTKCGVIKSINNFHYRKDQLTYRKSCKLCRSSQHKKWKHNNPIQVKINAKRYRVKNKENIKLQTIIRLKRYPEKRKLTLSKYRLKNKQKIQQHEKMRLKTDINFKIIHNLRRRLRSAIYKNIKSGHTLELIGCTIDELTRHLKSLFIGGMTWDNYGQWHIDHILPCAIFDMSDPIEQKQCFHFSNLQPLWASDNIKKGAKIALPCR